MAKVCGITVSDDVLKRLMQKSSANKRLKIKQPVSDEGEKLQVKSSKCDLDGCNSWVKKTKKQQAEDLKSRDDDLAWLDKLLLVDRELVVAVATGKTKQIKSAHKKRIAELALNRSLYTGRQREHFIQVRLFYYVENNYPEYYDDMYANPMGGYRPNSVGWEMIAEGAKTGQPDINIDCPKEKYFGLRLEVKSSIGSPSENQTVKLKRLNDRGYFAVLGYGYEECKKILDDYFSMKCSFFI